MAYYNPKLQEQMRIYSFKVKLIERLCSDERKLKKLVEILDDFNIPMSRYV